MALRTAPAGLIRMTLIGIALSFLLSSCAVAQDHHQVTVTETSLVIPTYQIGPAEKDPVFYSGLAYQGAQRRVYPYPLQDVITDHQANKSYRAIYLENEFITICILPELGGRIFIGKDKTDGYDFFYHQHVIKPALIGMNGAWISGGVEWDVPHHHRASSFMPVDYRIESNADGSKTVWVGEIELRDRMRWSVGITLYPGKSYVEATVKIANEIPVANSMLYFANVAVAANKDYQVIFPPSTQYATYHAKNQFLPWPISDQEFGGRHLNEPRDMSWWKNHDSSTSWFAWNASEDFFGGYDHGRDAGVVHIADHNMVPGKKFFTWGTGEDARTWEKVLTDHDGPYLELMAGAYSDNQPDYSWMEPYESRTFKEYWYPVRKMGGFKNANTAAAVNLQITDAGEARVAFNTTSEVKNAGVQLIAGGKTLFEKQVTISPDQPFSQTVQLPAGTQEDSVTATLRASDGKQLISYTPKTLAKEPVPQPVTPPPAPQDIKTVEELYLTGLRLVQFQSPARDPYKYFEEALRRDPEDLRTNTELGILYCKRFLYAEAETHLEAALTRSTHDYTRPKNGEAYYYLGLALLGENKMSEAYDAFSRATWSEEWQAAGFYHLALIESARGKYEQALDHLSHSLIYNADNTQALNLKATLLRKLARRDAAMETALLAEKIDPFDLYAAYERMVMQPSPTTEADFRQSAVSIPNDVQPYLEAAVQYADAGLWDDAISILEGSSAKTTSRDPMVEYFLGYFYDEAGDASKALAQFQQASQLATTSIFPFRAEALPVLQRAVALKPSDSHAYYLLGNLLYDKQPEKAIGEWTKAAQLDPSDANVQSNLAVAYWQSERNPSKAIPYMEKAMVLDPTDGYRLAELGQMQQSAGLKAMVRLASLEPRRDLALGRDDTTQELVNLYLETGAYDQAINLLETRHFHVAEGGGEIHNSYIDAYLLRGRKHLEAKQYGEALADFQRADLYPENLEVGRPLSAARTSEIEFFIGLARESLKQDSLAKGSYEKAATDGYRGVSSQYYRALALQKLSRNSEATKIFEDLIAYGGMLISKKHTSDFFAKFGPERSSQEEAANAHYSVGLGLLGLGRAKDAVTEFNAVLALNPDHLGALTQMSAAQVPEL